MLVAAGTAVAATVGAATDTEAADAESRVVAWASTDED